MKTRDKSKMKRFRCAEIHYRYTNTKKKEEKNVKRQCYAHALIIHIWKYSPD